MPKALITGITGQDGAYLAEWLLECGYDVIGITRGSAAVMGEKMRWLGVLPRVRLVDGNLTDLSSLIRIIQDVKPDEVYNLAAPSFVAASWHEPLVTASVTGLGAVNVLEAIRIARPAARFYQASSSEMYGKALVPRQNEQTPFHPRSPYATAKLYAHWMTVNYREDFGLYACSGILFRHESPLLDIEFVTRKITDGVARIKLGLARTLQLGNLDAGRDLGHARDYVRAMWLMLQQTEPDDYVVAMGHSVTIQEIARTAFAGAGLNYQEHIEIGQDLTHPVEAESLVGDATKARDKLGWAPTVKLEQMLNEMVEADIVRHRTGMIRAGA